MMFVIYFFTIVNGQNVIVDTMPVPNAPTCIEIVNMINSQPSAGGRRVKAACYINSGARHE
jgi:hypothetical protein